MASAIAQGLRNPITNTVKLGHNQGMFVMIVDQRIYVMREFNRRYRDQFTQNEKDLLMFDSEGVEGYKNMVYEDKYVVVGLIKVGPKKLFVNVRYN